MSLRIELGALAEDISSQLEKQGVPAPENCKHLDQDAWQISRLHVRGLLTDSETAKARKRLIAEVRAALSKATA